MKAIHDAKFGIITVIKMPFATSSPFEGGDNLNQRRLTLDLINMSMPFNP